jgi:hypothetical protein
MFKVGQRVWCNEVYGHSKGFYTIKELEDNGVVFEEGFGVYFNSIHETADDMFETLGYKIVSSKDEETLMYLIGGKFVYFILKETHIYGKPKGYGCYEINDNGSKVQTTITPQLHLAIHQKLIELGWVK